MKIEIKQKFSRKIIFSTEADNFKNAVQLAINSKVDLRGADLRKEKAMLWPERFLSSIAVGQDLQLIGSKFLFEIVKRQYDKLNADQLKLVGKEIFQVLYVLDASCKDGVLKGSDFASVAYSAASATDSVAIAAAKAAEYDWMSKLLISLIQEII